MTSKKTEEQLCKKWCDIVSKCWCDHGFKERCKKDCTAVLKENGIECPCDCCFKCVENTKNCKYLVIPEKPCCTLSEKELRCVAAAGCCCICQACCCNSPCCEPRCCE